MLSLTPIGPLISTVSCVPAPSSPLALAHSFDNCRLNPRACLEERATTSLNSVFVPSLEPDVKLNGTNENAGTTAESVTTAAANKAARDAEGGAMQTRHLLSFGKKRHTNMLYRT